MVLWAGDPNFRLLIASRILKATHPDGDPLEDIHRLWPEEPIVERAPPGDQRAEHRPSKRRRIFVKAEVV